MGQIGDPIGAMHFGGEHTGGESAGDTDGAMASGERAADEIAPRPSVRRKHGGYFLGAGV